MNLSSLPSLFDLEHFEHRGIFAGCSFVWDPLKNIKSYLKDYKFKEKGATFGSNVWFLHPELIEIGEGTVIEPGTYIMGPCIIGKGCTIRHGAYLRGNCIIGDGCVVGHTSEVKSSIFLNGAQAAHFAYVGDSILGNKVNLGAGTKLANLKFNHSEVIVHYENKKIPTGLKKFGAILGDGAQLGCNCVTNPGTVAGKGAWIYPCMNVGGIIEEGKPSKRRP